MDVPVLGAAAYTGLAVWHGGLSGSAPLKAAESAQFTQGAGEAIAVAETLFSPLNFVVSGGLLVLLPLMCIALAPKGASVPVPVDAPASGRAGPTRSSPGASSPDPSHAGGLTLRFPPESPSFRLVFACGIETYVLNIRLISTKVKKLNLLLMTINVI